jgi:hypothetical protein
MVQFSHDIEWNRVRASVGFFYSTVYVYDPEYGIVFIRTKGGSSLPV